MNLEFADEILTPYLFFNMLILFNLIIIYGWKMTQNCKHIAKTAQANEQSNTLSKNLQSQFKRRIKTRQHTGNPDRKNEVVIWQVKYESAIRLKLMCRQELPVHNRRFANIGGRRVAQLFVMQKGYPERFTICQKILKIFIFGYHRGLITTTLLYVSNIIITNPLCFSKLIPWFLIWHSR